MLKTSIFEAKRCFGCEANIMFNYLSFITSIFVRKEILPDTIGIDYFRRNVKFSAVDFREFAQIRMLDSEIRKGLTDGTLSLEEFFQAHKTDSGEVDFIEEQDVHEFKQTGPAILGIRTDTDYILIRNIIWAREIPPIDPYDFCEKCLLRLDEHVENLLQPLALQLCECECCLEVHSVDEPCNKGSRKLHENHDRAMFGF